MDTNETSETNEKGGEFESSAPEKSARQWAMGCHLIGLCGIIIPVPASGLIGTLVLWLIKREDSAFIDEQGKEAVNFQISLFIYASICIFLSVIGIGLLLLFPLAIFGFVCTIIAAIKSSEGISFRYPASIRLVK